jgi:signal transduction histidine kinase
MREASAAALDVLLERGLAAFVWLDEALVVRERQGALADWVVLGQSLEMALPPFAGMEDAIRALRGVPGSSEQVPNVGMQAGERTLPKMNLQIVWHAGRSLYLVIVTREITQGEIELELRRETQRRLLAEARELEMSKENRRANEELSRANRDLEEFAYVISHDLKAPLRALRVTADLLDRQIGGTLEAEAREGLARIRLQARRMAAMMSGLLEYSRIGRKREALAEVDTGKLVREIVATIGAPDGMRVEIAGDWPVLTTLGAPLDVVLRNLIDNALKHHDTRVGRITVAAKESGASWRFTVADDGPGIEPGYHEAIFEPFRQISEVAPDSSGIGLALVKKTVELAGGRLRVESDPARRRGATFVVDWPKELAGV